MTSRNKKIHGFGLGARAMFATVFSLACLGNSAIAAD